VNLPTESEHQALSLTSASQERGSEIAGKLPDAALVNCGRLRGRLECTKATN
jgi:hypothetical protein